MTHTGAPGRGWARRRGAWGALAVLGVVSACGTGSSASGGATQPSPTHQPAVHKAASGGVAVSSGVAVGRTSAGAVLVDGAGRTLYAFAVDPKGRSVCNGSCATYWPPVPGSEATAKHPASVTARLGVTTRSDGSKQLTVDGYPMYTYAGDSAPGQAKGEGVNASGGLWWVVAPSGAWVKKGAPSHSPSAGGSRGAY